MINVQDLFNLESELHQASVRKTGRVQELLADDFLEFGSSGRIYDKSYTINMLGEEDPVGYKGKNYQARILAPDLVAVTYAGVYQSTPPRYSLRMSLWKMQKDGRWQMTFHQGTPTTEEKFNSMSIG